MQMKSYALAALCALGLSMPLTGCQTPEQSAISAENTCSAQGLRGRQYDRCVRATYAANRAQSQQAENAAAVGVAAGVIGGALVGSAIADDHHHYHHYHHYRHCYHCW